MERKTILTCAIMKSDNALFIKAPPKTMIKVNTYAIISISFSNRCVQTIAAADPESTSAGKLHVSPKLFINTLRQENSGQYQTLDD